VIWFADDELWWFPNSKVLWRRLGSQRGLLAREDFPGTDDELMVYSLDDLIPQPIDAEGDVMVICGQARYYLAGLVSGRVLIDAALAARLPGRNFIQAPGEMVVEQPPALGIPHVPDHWVDDDRRLEFVVDLAGPDWAQGEVQR
jgi:hypothetical protein